MARIREPGLTTAQRLLLPLAVVSSAAAAAVPAAVGPEHFREAALFGLFFAISAALQLVWAGAVATRCSQHGRAPFVVDVRQDADPRMVAIDVSPTCHR